MLETGMDLPEANLLKFDETGPHSIALSSLTKGRKVVIFGLPGAFTRTCTAAHLPSFLRVQDDLRAKGVEEIICVSVNDPFVMASWGDSTGATEAGFQMLGDADGAFTKAIGMAFDAPPVGFYGRSQRYALLAEDNKVTILNTGDQPGECDITAGETLLAKMG